MCERSRGMRLLAQSIRSRADGSPRPTRTSSASARTWAAIEAYGTEPAEKGATPPGGVNPLTATYLNRLSDLLFILSRVVNPGGDVLWEPGAHSGAHAQRSATTD